MFPLHEEVFPAVMVLALIMITVRMQIPARIVSMSTSVLIGLPEQKLSS